VTIVRSGKRFIVRKTTRSQIVELGRYESLEKALSSVSGLQSDDEDLWCLYCLDDPSLQMCAFCGCRCCYGKHDAECLLLCDSCNQESHTYCLSPPLSAIPSSNWFCAACVRAGYDVEGGGVGGAGGLSADESSDDDYDYDGGGEEWSDDGDAPPTVAAADDDDAAVLAALVADADDADAGDRRRRVVVIEGGGGSDRRRKRRRSGDGEGGRRRRR
jgi:hypothetical protein